MESKNKSNLAQSGYRVVPIFCHVRNECNKLKLEDIANLLQKDFDTKKENVRSTCEF